MPTYPYETIGRGDKKTLMRTGWYSGYSSCRMLPGVQQAKDNYDDAEGWAPRINYGIVPQNFAGSLGSNSGGASNPNITTISGFMPYLRTKMHNSANSQISYSGRKVMAIRNDEEAYGNEVYTNHYHGATCIPVAMNTLNNQTWYMSMWVREKAGQGGYVRPRVTMWLFGVGYVYPSYVYTISGYSLANAASSTEASPSTGSSFYKQVQLPTSGQWEKIEMWGKFTNSNILALSMRIDVDDGNSGNTVEVLIDRMQLFPKSGIGLDKNLGGTNPDKLSESIFDTYKT